MRLYPTKRAICLTALGAPVALGVALAAPQLWGVAAAWIVMTAGLLLADALLAARLEGYSQQQLFADMDAWGYTFVLGSAQAWFERDAEDGRDWLLRHGLIDQNEQPQVTTRPG